MATFWRDRWALAWAGLTAAFAVHVVDEATHDFLAWYNPSAIRLQERLEGLPFPPVFSFTVWLAGLFGRRGAARAPHPLRTPGTAVGHSGRLLLRHCARGERGRPHNGLGQRRLAGTGS